MAPSEAFQRGSAINDAGQVVGNSETGGDSISHAFLYSDGQMIDLNSLIPADSGWEVLVEALDINDQGQIVGYGIIDGQVHAFLMTPSSNNSRPKSKADCKKGGYETYGFKNQGQCIKYVNKHRNKKNR